MDLSKILTAVANAKILVIGDAMLDKYAPMVDAIFDSVRTGLV